VTSRVALQTTQRTPSLVRFCWSAYSGSWSNVLPHGMRQTPKNSTGLLGSPDDPGPKPQEEAVGEFQNLCGQPHSHLVICRA